MVRTIEQLTQHYLAALASVNDKYDLSEGSFAFVMARASAALALENDNLLQNLLASKSLFKASGKDLEALASDYGVIRQPATYAQGTVTFINTIQSTLNISPGTEIFNLTTGTNYLTQNVNSVSISQLTGASILVRAVLPGSKGNLAAGTKLYAPNTPSVSAVVGTVWNAGIQGSSTNSYIGDLAGGENEQSDADLALLVYRRLASYSVGSKTHIVDLLKQYSGVERSFVKAAVGGIVEIWVDGADSYTQQQKDDLLAYINPYMPAGSIPVVIQANRRQLDLVYDVIPFRSQDLNLDLLNEQVKQLLDERLNRLQVGESITISDLLGVVSPLFLSTKISSYTNLNALPNELIVLGSVKITYPIH